ncbi:unknown [Coprobacillus sp. CAG:698]|nr:unknown [Coprobacillus sp. CAG:698]
MTRISKYILLLVISILLSISLGCNLNIFRVETVENDGSFTLTIDEDVLKYLNTTDIPNYTCTFDGVLKSSKYRTGEFEIAFYDNDDFFLSRIIENLINEYKEKNRVSFKSISSDNETESWMNRKQDDVNEKEYIKIKDNKIYNEIVYISLENGLQLSINYARFSDFEGNTYYRWQKTEGIRFVLHYPLMVYHNEEHDRNEVVVMPLPNGVIYYFDTTTKQIDALLKNDKYLKEEYYKFGYVNSYEKDYDNIVNYYLTDAKGVKTSEGIECEFMSNKFLVTFAEDSFSLKLII